MEKSETFVIHILQGMDCMSICAFSLEAVKLLPLYTYILTFVDITEYLTVKYFSFRVYIDCLSCSIWEESRNTLLSLLLLAYTGYPLVEYALIACCCYCIGSFFCMNLLRGYIVFFWAFNIEKVSVLVTLVKHSHASSPPSFSPCRPRPFYAAHMLLAWTIFCFGIHSWRGHGNG